MDHNRISIRSEAWRQKDTGFVADRLLGAGIRYADEILALRVFDLLNLNRIDAGTAEETILVLYRLYNPNTLVDRSLEEGTLDQYFPFPDWRKKHRDLSVLTVGEFVMTEGINHRAIVRICSRLLKAFYRSEEYCGREYRYLDFRELIGTRAEKTVR